MSGTSPAPLKKDAYSLDTGYSQCVGMDHNFNDVDNTGGSIPTVNSYGMRKCILVYNNSGGTLLAASALTFMTGQFGKNVQNSAAGQVIHGFVQPYIGGSATGTIPNLAYFWMTKEGFCSANGDGSTITAGDKLTAAGATGTVKSDLNSDLLYSEVAASTAVTNTVTPTTFDKSFTIPANTLKVGDVIRVTAQAIATATHSTDTLQLNLLIGSTVVGATAAVDVANNDIGVFTADIVVRTIGASGTIVAEGQTVLGPPASATLKDFSLASTAIDTTATQLVGVQATWSVADPGNSCRLDVLDIQRLSVNAAGQHLRSGTATATISTAVPVRQYANCQW